MMIKSQDTLGLQTGIIIAVPIPKDKEANATMIKKGIDEALAEADE